MGDPQDNMGHLKIMAGIGGVCVEWALLEHMILGLIACAENIPLEKAYIIFGGLDMQPRINAAIKLTKYAKWPAHLIKRIEVIRTEVQGKSGRGGLGEKRNQAVHGVHKQTGAQDSISLTMVRWGEPKRTQDVSIMDLYNLAKGLGALAQEAGRIFDDYGVWKFGPSGPKDSDKQLVKVESSIFLKIAKDFKGSVKSLLSNFVRR